MALTARQRRRARTARRVLARSLAGNDVHVNEDTGLVVIVDRAAHRRAIGRAIAMWSAFARWTTRVPLR